MTVELRWDAKPLPDLLGPERVRIDEANREQIGLQLFFLERQCLTHGKGAVSLIDGSQTIHPYHSREQAIELYARTGTLAIIYTVSVFEPAYGAAPLERSA